MSAAPDDGAARAYGYAPPAAGSARRAELDRLLDLAVRDTGAHAGAVFLLAPDGQALRLEVTTGMPAEYLAPWLGCSRAACSARRPAVRDLGSGPGQ